MGVNAVCVEQNIVEFRKRVPFAFSRRAILAYSQGAFAALNLVLEHSHLARGILAVSPGSLTNPKRHEVNSSLKGKAFVLCYGEKDDANGIRQAKDRMAAAKARGASIEIHPYPNKEHLIPDDLYDRLDVLIKIVESLGEKSTP